MHLRREKFSRRCEMWIAQTAAGNISATISRGESAASAAWSLLLGWQTELQWRGDGACHHKLQKRCKMKTLSPVLMVLLLAGAASAQSPAASSDPPGVTVLQKSWRSQVRNPALDEDPFLPNYEYREAVRTQQENIRQTAISLRTTGVAVNNRPRTILRADFPPGLHITYVYSAKIRNTGEKTIQSLVWEYVFFDPATPQKELGHHQQTSRVKIRPGKSQDLSRRSTSPPAQVIDASEAKDPAPKLSGRVVIHRIEYTDGSVWQRPAN